jgi:hypothetical protein
MAGALAVGHSEGDPSRFSSLHVFRDIPWGRFTEPKPNPPPQSPSPRQLISKHGKQLSGKTPGAFYWKRAFFLLGSGSRRINNNFIYISILKNTT